MEYAAFIKRVQQRVGFDAPAEAVRTIEATLETLGERLSLRETRQLAAELPKELRASLLQRSAQQLFPWRNFSIASALVEVSGGIRPPPTRGPSSLWSAKPSRPVSSPM
jgi:uncharacterized protein (DUF2267 family)